MRPCVKDGSFAGRALFAGSGRSMCRRSRWPGS